MSITNRLMSTGAAHWLSTCHPEFLLDPAKRLLKRLTHRRREKQATPGPLPQPSSSPKLASDSTPASQLARDVPTQSAATRRPPNTNPFEDDDVGQKAAAGADVINVTPPIKKGRAPEPPSRAATSGPQASANAETPILRPQAAPRRKQSGPPVYRSVDGLPPQTTPPQA